MKQKIFSFLLFLTVFVSQAQEATETATAAETTGWSMQTKYWMLGIFVIVSIIAVLRTFRGKADV